MGRKQEGKVIAVIHARMTSSRLPGKVLMDVCGKTIFHHHVERLRQCPGIESITLGTTKSAVNEPLVEEARRIGIGYYQGAEEDVVERYLTIASNQAASVVVRVGCDKPLFSYEIINHMLDEYKDEDLLYVKTPLGKGVGSEIVSLRALELIHDNYRGPAITKYIYEYPHLFSVRGIDVDDEFSRPEFRLTLDTMDDFNVVKSLYEKFYRDGSPVDIREVFKYLDDNPSIANMNRFTEEKEVNRYVSDLQNLPVMTVHRHADGYFYLRNRMGEIVPRSELQNIMDKIK